MRCVDIVFVVKNASAFWAGYFDVECILVALLSLASDKVKGSFVWQLIKSMYSI